MYHHSVHFNYLTIFVSYASVKLKETNRNSSLKLKSYFKMMFYFLFYTRFFTLVTRFFD